MNSKSESYDIQFAVQIYKCNKFQILWDIREKKSPIKDMKKSVMGKKSSEYSEHSHLDDPRAPQTNASSSTLGTQIPNLLLLLSLHHQLLKEETQGSFLDSSSPHPSQMFCCPF